MRGFQEMGVLSPSGRCAAFADDADGIVRGEGCTLFVLKLLSAAVRDHDPIHALVTGSAMNQDGRSFGLTAPSEKAQEAVLRRAYSNAGIKPADVSYIEAHGTGTRLGDPVEARALGAVLAQGREQGRSCLLGSVKSNLGHLEAAAGAAGMLKTVLMLRNGRVVPGLHFDRPNRLIPFDELGLRVVTACEAWPEQKGPRIAGVSAFGFGGTNAHVVIEEPPVLTELAPAEPIARLFVLSAADPRTLDTRIESFVPRAAELPHADLCQTVCLRRTPLEFRFAVVSATGADLAARLAAGVNGPAALAGRAQELPQNPVFVFPGQGPVWWPLDRRLLTLAPAFGATLEECAGHFRNFTEIDLMSEIFQERDRSRLSEPAYLFPALFALQIALVRVWKSMGIAPAAVTGHSTGEIAAAHVAGILSLEDACRVIAHRGRLIGQVVGNGTMAIAEVSRARAEGLLEPFTGKVSIAAVNGHTSVVLSGDRTILRELGAKIAQDGVFFREVEAIRVAGHSPVMDPILEPLRQSIRGIRPRKSQLPFFSTVAGRALNGEEPDFAGEHWIRNLREPVLFLNAVESALDAGFANFLEIGPHPVFSPAIRNCLERRQTPGLIFRGMRREGEAVASFLETAGNFFVHGFPVRFEPLFPAPVVPPDLPPYPFRSREFWFEDQPDPESGEETEFAKTHQKEYSREAVLALPPAERAAVLERLVRQQTARVLAVNADSLAGDRSLRTAGLDSLMAVEIKNQIEDLVGVPLNAAEFIRGGTIRAWTTLIAERLEARQAAASSGDPDASTAAIPLTPAQAWFFDHGLVEPHHWNLSCLLETPLPFEASLMGRAIERIRERHPAYSLTIEQNGTDRQQVFHPPGAVADVFEELDLSGAENFSRAVEAECFRLQTGLNIFDGPLFRVAFMNAGAGLPGRLFVVMHHLITDGFGFALFLGELRAEYLALLERRPLDSVRGLPYPEFCRIMDEFAQSEKIKADVKFWESEKASRPPPLPVDFPGGELIDGSLVTVADSLDESRTVRFLEAESNDLSDAQTRLLTAVVRGFARRTGAGELRIELETHGRSVEGIDASRTHGWCNVMFPLLLRGGLESDPARTEAMIHADLARVPHGGASFGLLRFCTRDAAIQESLRNFPAPQVKVIYHGAVFEQIRSAAMPFSPARENPGPNYAGGNRPKYLIYVYGAIFDNRLQLQILYSRNLHREETMQELIRAIKMELEGPLS